MVQIKYNKYRDVPRAMLYERGHREICSSKGLVAHKTVKMLNSHDL